VKTITIEQAKLDTCVEEAQRERLLIVRDGKPVALIVGVEGMDEEQLALGSSDRFWKLIAERREQKTLSRTQLEERLRSAGS
jgi:antitoxin (DNA-binding transcriptional repressor) of toxin-antitoxin stability system